MQPSERRAQSAFRRKGVVPSVAIRTVAIVGSGLIGSGWAAFFLSRGLDVVATDPASGAEAALRREVDRMWPLLEAAGLAEGASKDRLSFQADLETAVAGVDFVQENAPERLEVKRDIFRRMDAVLPEHVVIASSSSALRIGDVQSACERHPERCLIAHPFNPPHIIPLVEIVGGDLTSAAVLDSCQAFFDGLGKQCVRLKREVNGHVANRLAWALYREAVWLVEQGYVDAADVDRAVAWGPGLRWAAMGPHLLYHLGGGQGGIHHFFAQFSDTLRGLWSEEAVPDLTPQLQTRLGAQIGEMTHGRSIADLSDERDRFLIELLGRKAEAGQSIAS